MTRIESLLSARLFIAPQLVDEQLFFLSNLSGHISLYVMNFGGSVPEPLLPPNIAVQNPHLLTGYSFYVFPDIDRIVIMLDQDGDENYQPMSIPLSGGFPEPLFGDRSAEYRFFMLHVDPVNHLAYFRGASHSEAMNVTFRGDLVAKKLEKLDESVWGSYFSGVNHTHTKTTIIDGYSAGDHVLYLWTQESPERKVLYGTPLEERQEGQDVPINAIGESHFVNDDKDLLFTTALFNDSFGLGSLSLDTPQDVKEVTITGTTHKGSGELENIDDIAGNRYRLTYNIDGCTWVYEGTYDEKRRELKLDNVIVGKGELSNGVLEHLHYDKKSDRYVLSFSTAVSPTQIYTVEGKKRDKVHRHTNEKVLGIPDESLSKGEDASFMSFDGTRISARMYRPAEALAYEGPRPLIYYVHGGPQSQERPDFSWFSMSLIQYLTLQGFAVFVPNVRGSTGYGLSYTKEVDKDWGGQDRLDHVHAMKEFLPKDERIDIKRTGVVGRSYGGFMTLTLTGRHPKLWAAGVDMFGPYDLLTFIDRIPETWKPYFKLAVGDPEQDREFLTDRSPRTHIENLSCPLLVIQGKNDPRVVEKESRDLVDYLNSKGKKVDYLMFENEGHDVLKYENRVECYNRIVEFFTEHLRP